MTTQGGGDQASWEVFWCAWVRRMGNVPHSAGAGEQRRRAEVAGAIGHAGRETVRFLRNARQWSWLNAYLLAGLLTGAATEWARAGAADPVDLFARLRRAGAHEGALSAAELRVRLGTETALGAPGRSMAREARKQA